MSSGAVQRLNGRPRTHPHSPAAAPWDVCHGAPAVPFRHNSTRLHLIFIELLISGCVRRRTASAASGTSPSAPKVARGAPRGGAIRGSHVRGPSAPPATTPGRLGARRAARGGAAGPARGALGRRRRGCAREPGNLENWGSWMDAAGRFRDFQTFSSPPPTTPSLGIQSMRYTSTFLDHELR